MLWPIAGPGATAVPACRRYCRAGGRSDHCFRWRNGGGRNCERRYCLACHSHCRRLNIAMKIVPIRLTCGGLLAKQIAGTFGVMLLAGILAYWADASLLSHDR